MSEHTRVTAASGDECQHRLPSGEWVNVPAKYFREAAAYADGYVDGRESAPKAANLDAQLAKRRAHNEHLDRANRELRGRLDAAERTLSAALAEGNKLRAELASLKTKGFPAWGMLVNEEYERLRMCICIKELEAERDALKKELDELKCRVANAESDLRFIYDNGVTDGTWGQWDFAVAIKNLNRFRGKDSTPVVKDDTASEVKRKNALDRMLILINELEAERDELKCRVAELEGMHRRLEKVGPFTGTDMFVLFDRAETRYYVCSEKPPASDPWPEPDSTVKRPAPPRPRLFTTSEKDDFVSGCDSGGVKVFPNEVSRGWWTIALNGKPILEGGK